MADTSRARSTGSRCRRGRYAGAFWCADAGQRREWSG